MGYPSTREAAVRYATAGLFVHTLERGAKKSYTKGWPKRATNDVATVDDWFASEPWSNVGIVLEPSNLIVFDFDTYSRKYDGDMGEWLREFFERDRISMVRSASGGYHYYCWMLSHWSSRAKIGAPIAGLDIKKTGLVVAPYSRVGENYYCWVRLPSKTNMRVPLEVEEYLNPRFLKAHDRSVGAPDYPDASIYYEPDTGSPTWPESYQGVTGDICWSGLALFNEKLVVEAVRVKVPAWRTHLEVINGKPIPLAAYERALGDAWNDDEDKYDRSRRDQKIATHLAFQGWSIDEIVAFLVLTPTGPYGKSRSVRDSLKYLHLTAMKSVEWAEENSDE